MIMRMITVILNNCQVEVSLDIVVSCPAILSTLPLHYTYLGMRAIKVVHEASLLNYFNFYFNWMIEEEEAADCTDMPSEAVLAEAINAVE